MKNPFERQYWTIDRQRWLWISSFGTLLVWAMFARDPSFEMAWAPFYATGATAMLFVNRLPGRIILLLMTTVMAVGAQLALWVLADFWQGIVFGLMALYMGVSFLRRPKSR